MLSLASHLQFFSFFLFCTSFEYLILYAISISYIQFHCDFLCHFYWFTSPFEYLFMFTFTHLVFSFLMCVIISFFFRWKLSSLLSLYLNVMFVNLPFTFLRKIYQINLIYLLFLNLINYTNSFLKQFRIISSILIGDYFSISKLPTIFFI